MPKKIKKKKHHTPKISPLVTSPADLRLLQTVGKGTFVMLAGKKMANWAPCLKATTFLRKGSLCTYTDKSIILKLRYMTELCNQGLMRDLLFDIYYQPSRIDIKTRKLAGRYYKRLCKNAKLPPMVR
ncbi:MAG: hypothetical protein ACLRFJ_00630 [Alphaproteobacteria bacterium]